MDILDCACMPQMFMYTNVSTLAHTHAHIICDRTGQNESLTTTSHNYTALTNFLKLSFYQETIAKTLFFQMVAVYMGNTQLK